MFCRLYIKICSVLLKPFEISIIKTSYVEFKLVTVINIVTVKMVD